MERLKQKLNDKDAQLEHLKRRLDQKDVKIRSLQETLGEAEKHQVIVAEQAGSIVEAALKLNQVFEAAQAAADQYLYINVAIKHCHINKIFYSRFARPLRGNRKTWQLLLRQVHVFQIGKEIFTCRSNNVRRMYGTAEEEPVQEAERPAPPTEE